MILIMPEFINHAMPSWFVYLFMLALLSAGMSTLSSQFHTMGTALGRDFSPKKYQRHDDLQDRCCDSDIGEYPDRV